MRNLAPKMQKGAFRRAGTKAMRPVRDAARAGAQRLDDPSTASNIAKNIVTRAGSRRDERRYGGGVVVTKVGVQGGAKSYKNNDANRRSGRAGGSYHVDDPATFHWRFLELGTRFIPANRFMTNALESKADEVTRVYVTALGPEIDKALK
jgi:HK97 gp10 family phage protein